MIGVLDLQGGVVEHVGHLSQLGIPVKRVKTTGDLMGLCGLILPGGESTCLARLLRLTHLDEAILAAYANGLYLWGTCAGAILLARRIENQDAHLGLLDISVRRNAFGSQLDSFRTIVRVPSVSPDPVPLVFIRAPVLFNPGPSVRVLAELQGGIAAAEDEQILVTAFHPELSESLVFHRYFAAKCGIMTVPDRYLRGDNPRAVTDGGRVWPRIPQVMTRV